MNAGQKMPGISGVGFGGFKMFACKAVGITYLTT